MNIIREIHDQSVSKHFDVRRICKYLHKWYYWSQAKQSVKRYIRNCHICRRFKTTKDKYFDLLNFLSISNRSWTDIIMNLVTELLENKDFNAILMIINRLIKIHHYIFCIATEKILMLRKSLDCWSIMCENYTNYSISLYQIEYRNSFRLYEKSCVKYWK